MDKPRSFKTINHFTRDFTEGVYCKTGLQQPQNIFFPSNRGVPLSLGAVSIYTDFRSVETL